MDYDRTNPPLRTFLDHRQGFGDGNDSPRAYLEDCIARIEDLDGEVKAFVTLNLAGAREAADAAAGRYRAGAPLSAVDGMPIGIKDIIETRDMPTQMGSPIYDGWHSHRDAATVRALREAGAVIIGKTVTTEFATTTPGPTHNPFDTARTPGGSSSGSAAAVGVGMIPAALGTQVVGSILRPASYCGCFGFKPTLGAINRGGSHDALSQSCHGVIAASLADNWAVMRVMADRAGGDPGYPGLIGGDGLAAAAMPKKLIRLDTFGWTNVEDEARDRFEAALARLSKAGVEIITRRDDAAVEALEQDLTEATPLTRTLNAWESRWPLNDYRDRDVDQLSSHMRARLEKAEAMTLDDYRQALGTRDAARNKWRALSGTADGFVTLAATGAAPMGLESTGDSTFNATASLLGVPAITLPVMEADGLPLGLQLLGFHDGDETLFAHAGWVMEALG